METNPFSGKYHLTFSVAAFSHLEIGPGNSLDVDKWIDITEKARESHRFGVSRLWYEAFKEQYQKVHPDSDFDHTFGTIVLNGKEGRVMSYGKLVSCYYYNNSCPNLFEVHILHKGKYD